MVISTGNLVTSGSTTYVVGTSSRLDTSALIENAVAAKNLKADRIDVQVDENQAKISAYSEFQTLSQNVQSALEALKRPASFLSDEGNIFDGRAGYVGTSDGSDASAYVDIAVERNAAIASYEIEVLQTAEAHKAIGTSFADKNADLGYAGTFDIGLAGATAATINVTADMSLQELADAINAQSDTTGVQAAILKVSETDFQLVLTAQETNKAIEVTNVTGDDVLNLVGVTDGVGGFQNVLQAEQPAIIEVDGVTVTRDDNVFDDLLDGVEINVRNAAPGTIITLDIDNDVSSVKDAIVNFVDAYNELRSFITKNQQVSSDGAVSEGAVLFSDFLIEGLSGTIADVVGADFSSASALATIRELGLTFGANNQLTISDEAALDTAILNNYDDVVSFFSSDFASDNTQFALLSNNSSATTQNIVFDIVVDGGGTITSVTANGDNTAFTIEGTRIIGAAGTIYEGLTFSYQGNASATINTSLSQGLADRLYNAIDDYSNSVDGLIIQQRAAIEAENEDLNAEATRIREKTEEFRLSEIERYAEFEAKISALNSLLDQIRAILGRDDDD